MLRDVLARDAQRVVGAGERRALALPLDVAARTLRLAEEPRLAVEHLNVRKVGERPAERGRVRRDKVPQRRRVGQQCSAQRRVDAVAGKDAARRAPQFGAHVEGTHRRAPVHDCAAIECRREQESSQRVSLNDKRAILAGIEALQMQRAVRPAVKVPFDHNGRTERNELGHGHIGMSVQQIDSVALNGERIAVVARVEFGIAFKHMHLDIGRDAGKRGGQKEAGNASADNDDLLNCSSMSSSDVKIADVSTVADFELQLSALSDAMDKRTLCNGVLRRSASEAALSDVLQRVLQLDVRPLLNNNTVDDFVYTVCARTHLFERLLTLLRALERDADALPISNATATRAVRECALQPDAIELLTALMRFFRPGTVAGRLLDALEVLDPADDATIEFLVDRLVTCRDAAIARDLFYQCARLRRVETFRRVFAAHPSPALANRALRVAAASGDIDFVRAMLSFASIRQDIGIDRCLALRDAVQSNHAHVVAALLAVDELVSECVLRALQFGFQRASPLPMRCLKLLVDDARVDPLSAEHVPFAVAPVDSVHALARIHGDEVPELSELVWMMVLQRSLIRAWPLAAVEQLPPYVVLEILDLIEPKAHLVSHARKLQWVLRLRKSVANVRQATVGGKQSATSMLNCE